MSRKAGVDHVVERRAGRPRRSGRSGRIVIPAGSAGGRLAPGQRDRRIRAYRLTNAKPAARSVADVGVLGAIAPARAVTVAWPCSRARSAIRSSDERRAAAACAGRPESGCT